MTIPNPRLDATSWGLLALLAFLWSISFVFIKIAVAEIPVLALVLVRVGLAALVLHVVVLATRRRYPTEPAMLVRYGLMAFVNNVAPFALIVYATRHIGAGSASILNAIAPIFALLIAHVATEDEKITAPKLAGILLGIGGVAVMAGPQALSGLTANSLAVLAMLGATFFYGLAALVGRSFSAIDPIVSATCQLSAATLIVAPFALLDPSLASLGTASPGALGAAVALALACTALAYVVFFQLLARAGAINTILVTLLIPVGGVTLAWLLLGEALSWGEAGGMLLIGLGLVVIDGRMLALLGWSARPAPGFRPD